MKCSERISKKNKSRTFVRLSLVTRFIRLHPGAQKGDATHEVRCPDRVTGKTPMPNSQRQRNYCDGLKQMLQRYDGLFQLRTLYVENRRECYRQFYPYRTWPERRATRGFLRRRTGFQPWFEALTASHATFDRPAACPVMDEPDGPVTSFWEIRLKPACGIHLRDK